MLAFGVSGCVCAPTAKKIWVKCSFEHERGEQSEQISRCTDGSVGFFSTCSHRITLPSRRSLLQAVSYWAVSAAAASTPLNEPAGAQPVEIEITRLAGTRAEGPESFFEVFEKGVTVPVKVGIVRLDAIGSGAEHLETNSRALARLTSRIGWDNTELDCTRLLSRPTCTTIGVVRIEEGKSQRQPDLLSTATLTVLSGGESAAKGKRLGGWLSYVVTHPNFRRQGLARLVCSEVLALAHARFPLLTSVGLYGSATAAPLYRSLGFCSLGSAALFSGAIVHRSEKSRTFMESTKFVSLKPRTGLDTSAQRDVLQQVIERDREVLSVGDDVLVCERADELSERVRDYGEMSWCALDANGGVCGYAFGRLTSVGAVFCGPLWARKSAVAVELVRRVAQGASRSPASETKRTRVSALVPLRNMHADDDGAEGTGHDDTASDCTTGTDVMGALGLQTPSNRSELMVLGADQSLSSQWTRALTRQAAASCWEYA
mmetsp:Transcript_17469/g.37949  ORF Transcript_17469/g.37949 Transcript_17469/m.37949 type:complete len:488 (+) Transcript_17469:38-1501(+)